MIYYRNNYTQKWEEYSCPKHYMVNRISRVRRKRTTQERRNFIKDLPDRNLYNYKLRRKRSFVALNNWGIIEEISNTAFYKNWKEIYKIKKQYMKPKLKYFWY